MDNLWLVGIDVIVIDIVLFIYVYFDYVGGLLNVVGQVVFLNVEFVVY